jgi:hypothetical protein
MWLVLQSQQTGRIERVRARSPESDASVGDHVEQGLVIPLGVPLSLPGCRVTDGCGSGPAGPSGRMSCCGSTWLGMTDLASACCSFCATVTATSSVHTNAACCIMMIRR